MTHDHEVKKKCRIRQKEIRNSAIENNQVPQIFFSGLHPIVRLTDITWDGVVMRKRRAP